MKIETDKNNMNNTSFVGNVVIPDTGEIVEGIFVPKNSDTIVNIISLKEKEEYEKKKKKEQEIEKYRLSGKRREPFAQFSKGFEEKVVVNIIAKAVLFDTNTPIYELYFKRYK